MINHDHIIHIIKFSLSMADRRGSNGQERQLREVMEAIAVKFILNLPTEEKSQKVRLAYHYQKAYYYYIDELMKEYFPRANPKKVEEKWFHDRLNEVVSRYMRELHSEEILKLVKSQKPTCGAIIMNEKENKVLVIEAGKKLGFPKGGKNEGDTSEQCAAREVREEVGLIIYDKINPVDKIEFSSFGNVPAIYYIVRNVDENEQIKIQKNQIDDAFWMHITDVSRLIPKFTNKSRMAWKEFENKIVSRPSLSMDQFLNLYRQKGANHKQQQNQLHHNPLLTFKFDMQKLTAVLKQPFF